MFSEKLWKGLIINYVLIFLSLLCTYSVLIHLNEFLINEILITGIFSGILLSIIMTIIEILFYYLEKE